MNFLRTRQRTLAVVLALAFSAIGFQAALFAAHPPAAYGRGGAVVSAEQQATDAGLEVLRSGGNAVDAAVATALALAVVHPEAGNLGGGGFAVVKMANEVTTLDFREVAPSAATADMYLDADGQAIAEASTVGPLASGVPGSPRGLFELHQRYGSLDWKAVVEPAIRLAADGFIVTRRLAESIGDDRELLARFPGTAAVWLPNGKVPEAGSVLTVPALAETLAAYAEEGPRAITHGARAEAVERAAKRHGGILTAADLAAYEPVWRKPVRFDAFGWQFASMDLPSSGGIILQQTLQLAEQLGYPELPPHGADRAHLLTEIWRRAYADRFRLGDPASTEATVSDLTAPTWLTARAESIDLTTASTSETVSGWQPHESADTTHLSVVDAEGRLVAITTTLNGGFGCGLLVSETGYLLNNEMDDFAAAPGQPNLYGLVQGEANAVRPGNRMLSSMSPTIAWQSTSSGERAVAVGGRGGSRIPTATVQILLNLVVDELPLQHAVDAVRVHHQWLPDTMRAEPGALSPETWSALESRGHTIEAARSIAVAQAVLALGNGLFEAAPDSRGPSAGGVAEPIP